VNPARSSTHACMMKRGSATMLFLMRVAISVFVLAGISTSADQSSTNGSASTSSTNASSPAKTHGKTTAAVSVMPCISQESPLGEYFTETKPGKVDVLTMPTVSVDKPYRGWLGIVFEWGPWAFALLLVLVSFLQALILEHHKKLFDRLATAASINSQAVLNAERPWVIVNAQIETSKHGTLNETFNLFIELKGRTPAIILQGRAEEPLSVNGEYELPDEPPYKQTTKNKSAQELLLVPGDSALSISVTPTNVARGSQTCFDLQELRREMYFYGRVVYRDMLEKDQNGKPVIRETRWCFRYIPTSSDKPALLERAGKSSYNRYS
jgi:hypothetical protein